MTTNQEPEWLKEIRSRVKGHANVFTCSDREHLLAYMDRLREALDKCKNDSGPKCQWCDSREGHAQWCLDLIVTKALAWKPEGME